VLLAVYLHEDFVDIKGITESSVSLLQSTCVCGSELDAPEADRFAADSNASFGEQIFNVAVAEVEARVEPDSIGNDIGRESVPFIDVHAPILAICWD
jgi:hypothetical protein